MYRLNKRGFTLVELIVVITILAILWTIWFISLQGYSVSARESARISDLATIQKSLDLFYTTENYYPDPTDFISVTYSWSLAWRQWIFWEETRNTVTRISQVPTDPLTKNPYAYSTINTRQEYQLWAISEGLVLSFQSISNQANAANSYYSNVVGNYNKQIVTVKELDKLYIIWAPTIITSEITNVTIQDILANQSFSIKNSKVLPGAYSSFLPEGQTLKDGTSFTPWVIIGSTVPVLYNWSSTLLSDDSEKIKFVENLISYYKNSNINNSIWLKDLLNVKVWEELAYVNTLIRNNTGGIPGGNIQVNDFTQSTACSNAPSNNKIFSGLITGFESNMWNPQANGTETFPEEICLDYNINSLPSASNQWKANWSIPGAFWNVIAFPNIYFGLKPWANSNNGSYWAKILERNISLLYNYNITLDDSYTNIYNTSLNLWLTNTQTASSSGVKAEIMVWTENNWLAPLGTLLASGISIGGQTYSLYRQNSVTDASGNQPGTWDYYAFIGSTTQRSGTLPVKDFLQYLVTNQGLDSNLYIHQAEFGPELVKGKGVISFTQANVTGLDLIPVNAFSFPPRSFSSADATTRVTSDYINIGNLTEIPRDFVVTSSDNQGNAVATSGNIIGGQSSAQSGQLVYWTALEVDIPNPGQTRTVSLDIDGVIGTWQVSRNNSPFVWFTVNDFTLTSGVSFYQLDYNTASIPQDYYTFTIEGTGNTNPRLQQFATGTATNGRTQNWGLNIDLNAPATGVQETITLVIDGQTVVWQITGP